jgi:hypothetical protein
MKHLPILSTAIAVIASIIGTTLAVDNRYAKSEEVKLQFCQARKQQLRDRIFELDLKPVKSESDKALRNYLDQQLREHC